MALPAGRYGVTKNQLLKIKKLPMNTIKLIEELTEKFNLLGSAAFKNSTSVVTQSTDLVESGAVKTAIEGTVGWIVSNNLWDEVWELGSINGQTGENLSDNSYVRTKNFIPVNASDSYKIINGNRPGNVYFLYYDANKNYIGSSAQAVASNTPFSPNVSGAKYARFTWLNDGSYNHDVIFGYADKVTTYEPYHASVEDSLAEKCDNSVIAPVENGSTASQAYAVGEHFIRDGKFCTVTVAVTTSSTWTLGSNYVEGDVASELTTITDACTDIITGATADTNVIKKYGNVIYLTLRLSGVSASAWVESVAIIPSAYRPKEDRIIINCMADSNPCGAIAYKSNGNIKIGTSISNKTLYVTGMWIL